MERTPVTRRIRRRIRAATGRMLDLAIGIDSSRQDMASPSENPLMMRYQPAYWLALCRGMRGIRVGAGDAFMDLGCGKGRVLYVASWYPFGRIIGVELNPRMAAVARRNLGRARGPARLRSVEVVEQDARSVALPDNLRVAFLFNPFLGAVFRAVAGRLKANADRTGTPLRLIYANPVEGPTLRKLGFAPVHESRQCTAFDYLGRPAASG
jgi:SAM-dependent methyltransferase